MKLKLGATTPARDLQIDDDLFLPEPRSPAAASSSDSLNRPITYIWNSDATAHFYLPEARVRVRQILRIRFAASTLF